MDWTYLINAFATMIGVAGTIAGIVWSLGRIMRPWMQVEAAAASDQLYKRLKENDFPHLESAVQSNGKRLDRLETDVKTMEVGLRDDMKTMEVGIRDDMKTMEVGIRSDMKTMEVGLRDDMKTMETGLRDDMKASEARLRGEIRDSEERVSDRIGRTENRIMSVLNRLADVRLQGSSSHSPSTAQETDP